MRNRHLIPLSEAERDRFYEPVSPKLATASTTVLDTIARSYGYVRRPGEPDHDLRQRISARYGNVFQSVPRVDLERSRDPQHVIVAWDPGYDAAIVWNARVQSLARITVDGKVEIV